ncbi:hypothetical protein [Pedobacter sp. GR22-6]|uniref:hypothetical protein n=1 Tax=Pedobacter sp. GR22-6 TaxID=3127957 RepID=UPI00307F2C89
MLYHTELLKRLESDENLKKAYAGQVSLGQNKLIALPVVIAFFAAFVGYYCYDLSKTDSSFTSYLQICIAIIALCIVAAVMMQAKAKKQVLGNLSNIKVCLAKKIYGNDQTQIHYCIYTTGKLRHDSVFLEGIADKIFKIDNEPDQQLQKKINKMFQPRLEGMSAAPELLPTDFTSGEQVYKKEFAFSSLNPEMQASVRENNDQFIVLSADNGNAVLLKTLPHS